MSPGTLPDEPSSLISSPAERKYLLVKGMSGMGNRMLCALTGILYARVSGRKLVVDWSDDVYSDDGSNSFHRFFVCPSAGRVDEIPPTNSVTPDIWRGHLRDSVRQIQREEYNRLLRARLIRQLARARLMRWSATRRWFQRHTSVDLSKATHQEEVAVLWSYASKVDKVRPHFRGEFAELGQRRTVAILRELLRHDLVLHPRIQSRVDEFKAEHFDGRTVGVHLRLSDRWVRVNVILDELDSLLSRQPDLRIFAATDNIEAKEMMEQRYPGVIMTPHWYPAAPGSSQHNNPECPDRTENGVEALVDLYLLGRCDYLVGDSASSFTRVAGLLMAAPEENIADVRPRRNFRTRFAREMWRRYAASNTAVSSLVRICARGDYPIG